MAYLLPMPDARGACPWALAREYGESTLGPGEGPVRSPCMEWSLMWQSQTQFDGVINPWVLYSDANQKKLDAAYLNCDDRVVLTFHGEEYIVDFSKMTQAKRDDPSMVRAVRRACTERKQWILVSKSEAADPTLLGAADNLNIENGVSKYVLTCDGILYRVSCPDGSEGYVDVARGRLYRSLSAHKWQEMFQLPMSFFSELPADFSDARDITLTRSDPYYKLVVRQCESTLCGRNTRVSSVQLHLRRRLYLQFMEKVNRMGAEGFLFVCFHGTSDANRKAIIDNNFSMRKIGEWTGNQGYYGQGCYFARHAQTALGYNRNSDELLCCLVVVTRVFVCPGSDSSSNLYHGKPCKSGFDAHLSPSGRELVIFNPRQVLPCFTLRLGHRPDDARDQD